MIPADAREIIQNVLVREIISIRTDSLWKMLLAYEQGRLPGKDEEGATGVFDNKGSIFLPGAFVVHDSDGEPIRDKTPVKMTPEDFREAIRHALSFDNATLIYHDSIATGVNLDNGFFSSVASNILTNKEAATKRARILAKRTPHRYTSADIARSYCPSYVTPPYGARTRLSSCIATCMVEPRLYFAQCSNEFNFGSDDQSMLWEKLREAERTVASDDGTRLAPSCVVVCHGTRYKKDALVGLTRIMGYGKYGQFATFNLEPASKELLREAGANRDNFSDDEVFAEHAGMRVAGVLRMYPPTKPGKRSARVNVSLIEPVKDIGLDIDSIRDDALTRYGAKTARKKAQTA